MEFNLVIQDDTRPCMIDDRKAIWHRWMTRKEVIPPSPMLGGHGGGEIQDTFALVEFEDGTIGEVLPYKVRFLDSGGKFAQFAHFNRPEGV